MAASAAMYDLEWAKLDSPGLPDEVLEKDYGIYGQVLQELRHKYPPRIPSKYNWTPRQAPASQYQAPASQYQASASEYQAPASQYQAPASQYQTSQIPVIQYPASHGAASHNPAESSSVSLGNISRYDPQQADAMYNAPNYSPSPTRPSWPPSEVGSSLSNLTPGPSATQEMISQRWVGDTIPPYEAETMYGDESDYPPNWDSGYDPNENNASAVTVLWATVTGNSQLATKDYCYLFDHVDFYRLIYIITTLRGNVSSHSDPELVSHATKILNRAGRPRGFARVHYLRPRDGFAEWQVQGLLEVLDDQNNAHRDDAYTTVTNSWIHTLGYTPKRILHGVPEHMRDYFDLGDADAIRSGKFSWDWRMSSFPERRVADEYISRMSGAIHGQKNITYSEQERDDAAWQAESDLFQHVAARAKRGGPRYYSPSGKSSQPSTSHHHRSESSQSQSQRGSGKGKGLAPPDSASLEPHEYRTARKHSAPSSGQSRRSQPVHHKDPVWIKDSKGDFYYWKTDSKGNKYRFYRDREH